MSTKEYIIGVLESNKGQSVSGAAIAKQLNVSRNAIWKAIKELEKEGYKIEGVPNKGYRLCEDNDVLSIQGMLPFLTHENISKKMHIYDSLESTNKTAKEMAIAGAEHGTVIIADCQTAGKGRYNRNFYSPSSHGIYMSFILKPTQIGINTPTLITSFVAVAVCEAIEAVAEKTPKIKWVNDIFLNDKKIGGILTEAITNFESGNIEWTVVGIGINFNTPAVKFPENLRKHVGSIFTNSNPSITRNRLAAEITNRILSLEKEFNKHTILEKYKQRLLMLEKEILVTEANETYKAVALDVDDIGRLVIKKNSGEICSLSAGEVSIQREKSTL